MSHYIPPTHEHDIDPLEGRGALVKGSPTFAEVTEAVARPIEIPHKAWWAFFLVALSMLGVLGLAIAWLFWNGVGVWGNNIPVGWGWPIVNFVFWVGIGHAGTLISAVLFLFRQKWRTSINRASEAMTIFAVICALLFPTIHVGRVWVIYWPIPLPNQMDIWPNFRSPLVWDFFAVGTYFTVSLLFWYVGLIPDIATMRDRAKTKIRQIAYGIFSLGWRGSARHWLNYEAAYLLLAAMATPLVLSVHSIVSFDFAVSQLPGWHTTIFPPYFVAGAIFSGFGMVLTLMIPIRKWFHLEHIIGVKHLENMGKIILLTGSLVGYAYATEFFIAWYSGNPYESFAFVNRAFGDYAWAYWIMVSCNVISPQFIWFKKIRRSALALFILSIFVNIGMWFERFVIVVTSLHHDFLPSSWDYFSPTMWDWATLIGSFGLFFTLFLLFLRYLPVIAMAEVKGVMPQANPHYVDRGKSTRKHSDRRAGGVTSGEMDSRHDFDDEPEAGAVPVEQSTSGSAKVVVNREPSGAHSTLPEDAKAREARHKAESAIEGAKRTVAQAEQARAEAKKTLEKAEKVKEEVSVATTGAAAKAKEAEAKAKEAEAKAKEAEAKAKEAEAKAKVSEAEAKVGEAQAKAKDTDKAKAGGESVDVDTLFDAPPKTGEAESSADKSKKDPEGKDNG